MIPYALDFLANWFVSMTLTAWALCFVVFAVIIYMVLNPSMDSGNSRRSIMGLIFLIIGAAVFIGLLYAVTR